MQNFKTVSFAESSSGKSKVVTIAFTERETDLFLKVAKLSSQEIRKLLSIDSFEMLCKKAEKDKRPISQYIKHRLSIAIAKGTLFATSDVTFKNSKSIPFQR